MKLRIDSVAEQTILTALRANDLRQAAQLMVRYYANAVFSHCSAQVEDREQAEDLTHTSFARAFTSLSSLHGQTTARSWLITLARECCLEQVTQQEAGVEPPQGQRKLIQSDSGRTERLKISESLHRRLEVLATAL